MTTAMDCNIHALFTRIATTDGGAVPPSQGSLVSSVDRQRLVRVLNPVSITEQLLVAEIARRAVLVRQLESVRNNLQQWGTAALQEIVTPQSGPQADAAAEISVFTSPKYVGLLQQEATAARGLVRALQAYDTLRHEAPATWPGLLQIDARFVSEPACLAHLARRYHQGLVECRRCGHAGEGNAIAVRRVWQCGRCQTQTGLRRGTCFEHSSVPLVPWFAAIRAVLLSPAVPIAELAAFLRIARQQTVHKMVRRIRAATESPIASQKLAGLDEIYLPTH